MKKSKRKISSPKITRLGAERLPDARTRRGAPAIYALDSMVISERVQVEGKSLGAVSAAIWRYQQKHPERFRLRAVKGKKNVVKIWRVA